MDKYSLSTMFRDIWHYITPYRKKFFIAVFFRVTSDISNLVPAYAYSTIISILTTQTGTTAWNNAVVLIIIWVVAVYYYRIGHDLTKYFGYQVGSYAGLDSKFDALKHMYKLDLNWHEKENSGNKIKRIDNANKGIDRTIESFFVTVIESAVNIIGVVAIFGIVDRPVTIILLLYPISYFFLSKFFSKRITERYKPISTEEENYEGLSFESINNIRTLKMLMLYKPVTKKINESLDRLKVFIRKFLFITRLRNHLLDVLTRITQFTILAYIIYQITNKSMAVGVLILFTSLFFKVADGIAEFAEVYNYWIIDKVYMSRFHALMNEKPTIEDQPNQIAFPSKWKEIKLHDLCFSYGEKKVLKNLNLTIKRGEKIGIVGISGAGKSTFVKLILDMYEDYTGSITYDFESLKDIKREDYINYVASVSQDTELFNATLAENITIGMIEPDTKSNIDIRVRQACDIANLNNVISKLPEGLNTIIGEKGFKLSGGERQRVGIARAVIRNPQIIILDEATSHLDSDSEQKIQSALDQMFKNVTAVVIAHRLSTLTKMDRIIVLENGEVVEEGKMEDLIRLNGKFAFFWRKQNMQTL